MTGHPRRWAMLGALAVALPTMSVSVVAGVRDRAAGGRRFGAVVVALRRNPLEET